MPKSKKITVSCTSPVCNNTYEVQHHIQGAEYFCHRHGLSQRMVRVDIVEDESIPRAFKKLRSALRERARIYNNFIKHHRARTDEYKNCLYKTHIVLKWGQVLDISDQAVRNALKELERLVNA